MRRALVIVVVAVTVGWIVGCAPAEQEQTVEEPAAPQHDLAADEATLSVTSDGWITAFNAGDGAAIAMMMSEDGMLMPPNAETVSGREAIGSYWQAFIDTGITGALRMNQLMIDGDVAVKIGEYDLFDAEGEMVDTGKWMEIWTRGGDGWELHRDIWNSNLPVSPPSDES